MGGDRSATAKLWAWKDFNPHHPCGWWHKSAFRQFWYLRFQSTPPVWVVTDIRQVMQLIQQISIHTTRVGGDSEIHPCLVLNAQFQSTPPVWVVTVANSQTLTLNNYFNPHHPCGWWLKKQFIKLLYPLNFNPHHPCGWWLILLQHLIYIVIHFNPHHPCGWWLWILTTQPCK